MIVALGKTTAEKREIQKDYQILLGITIELGRYREKYLKERMTINIFPTAYYHTTILEIKEMVRGKFIYPIEQMKLMIAFYDAYKINRTNWDSGKKDSVEKHWREHFEACENEESDITCLWSGFIMTTGATAHILYDLPRSLRYAYANRFDKNITYKNTDYFNDFMYANTLFENSTALTEKDIKSVVKCWDFIIKGKENAKDRVNEALAGDILPQWAKTILANLGVVKVMLNDEIVAERLDIWRQTWSNEPIKDFEGKILSPQPVLSHEQLIEKGKEFCDVLPTQVENKPLPAVLAKPSPAAPSAKSNLANLVGGTNPETLGRTLLKAIATNNKGLWTNCLHPILKDDRKVAIEAFDRIRSELEQDGITAWNLIAFSRVTFSYNPSYSQKDKGVYQGEDEFKGEQVRRSFEIEFTYKAGEFVGIIDCGSIMTVKQTKFLLASVASAGLRRL